jgi:hypothetical protein
MPFNNAKFLILLLAKSFIKASKGLRDNSRKLKIENRGSRFYLPLLIN